MAKEDKAVEQTTTEGPTAEQQQRRMEDVLRGLGIELPGQPRELTPRQKRHDEIAEEFNKWLSLTEGYEGFPSVLFTQEINTVSDGLQCWAQILVNRGFPRDKMIEAASHFGKAFQTLFGYAYEQHTAAETAGEAEATDPVIEDKAA